MVDVYRGEVEAQTHFFPPASLYQPVSVYRRTGSFGTSDISEEILSADQPGRGGLGINRFAAGLAKKAVLAHGLLADQFIRRMPVADVPVHPERRGSFRKVPVILWMGAVLHASNLLAAYSDMGYGKR